MLKKIRKYIKNPKLFMFTLQSRLLRERLSDEAYLKKIYKVKFKKELDLGNPKTFNEKLQWLKLYDRKPIYTTMVDKYEAKKYVADIIGEEYVIPTLGVWDRFEDIDFDSLPEQFVLKCTHDSGGLVICRDKTTLDLKKVKKKINKSLKRNFYLIGGREWPYKNVKPRIIAEQYMQDETEKMLPVYKFFCFNGEPRIIQVIKNDKQANESIDYFDTEWTLLDLRQNFPNSTVPLPRPKKLSEMLSLVKELAGGRDGFLRVDLYTINDRIYFSEFTFFSDSGLAEFHPSSWDEILGSWIQLPNIK